MGLFLLLLSVGSGRPFVMWLLLPMLVFVDVAKDHHIGHSRHGYDVPL